MIDVTGRPLDLDALDLELTAAGVEHTGVGTVVAEDGRTYLVQYESRDGVGHPVDLPPEAQPVVDAHDGTTRDRAAAFEAAEDAERLRIVAERAADDPAYAALAELALREKP